jgi:hypothetical protein
MIRNWEDGVLFGAGTTIAFIGFLRVTLGPIPDDWTIIPTGLFIAAVGIWNRRDSP